MSLQDVEWFKFKPETFRQKPVKKYEEILPDEEDKRIAAEIKARVMARRSQ